MTINLNNSLKIALISLTALSFSGFIAHSNESTSSSKIHVSIQSEDLRLNAWLDERFKEQLKMSPMWMTQLALKESYNEIDDYSEKADAKYFNWLERSVNELKGTVDYQKLSPEGKTSYDLWMFDYERTKAGRKFKNHQYLFDQMRGHQASLPRFLLNFHKVDNASDMEAYIDRIGGISRALRQVLVRAQLAASKNIRPPRLAFEYAIQQAERLLIGAPYTKEGESTIYKDAEAKIETLAEAGKITAKQKSDYLVQLHHALTEDFGPTIELIVTWLKADMANVDSEPHGASELPNGIEYYNYRLAHQTTTDMTFEEIHQLGVKEVERILTEMDEIRQRVEFDGDLQQFFAFVRDSPDFYYPNTDQGRADYLKDTEAFFELVNKQLPDYFGILPKAPLEVRRVEAFREQDGAPQHYVAGAPDGSRPGIFYTHMSDMSANSSVDMETVAYHEGNPGHHMQISIAQELTGIPTFRTQLRFTAYSEGWALYAEKLAHEMGGYEDPYKLLGHLSAEIWRAIRLVVDTGIHAKGWSKQNAIDYFLANSPIPETTVRAEVDRYFVMPAQATSYKIGMLTIQELRAKAETVLGDKFDIREFHDVVLGGGALPMAILKNRVNLWIDNK